MSNKTLTLLATVLLACVAVAVTPKIFSNKNSTKLDQKNISVNLSDFTEETTAKIMIKQGGAENILARENDQWTVNGEPADQSKITSLFADFKNGEIQKLASKNDQNQDNFKVTPENGITLVLTQNGQDEEFYIGKMGPSYGTFYIRKKGIKNVYLMKSGLRAKLSWDDSEWKPEEKNNTDNVEEKTNLPAAPKTN